MLPTFVHLHLHTEYSIVDGLIRIPALVKACSERNMPAVAVTDRVNLFAAVKFFKAAVSQGLKPIIGAELLIANPAKSSCPTPVVALCQNQSGYNNLLRLVSRAYTEGQSQGIPLIAANWLVEANQGLILLSGGRTGDIGQALIAGKSSVAEEHLRFWLQAFADRFYLEVIRTGRPQENSYNAEVINLAHRLGVPLIASNDVRFLDRDDYEAHEARVCINQGVVLADPQRSKLYSEQQYLRNGQEMAELFSDIPEALSNTIAVAKRCNHWMEVGKVYLPAFPAPAGQSLEEFFTEEAQRGLSARFVGEEITSQYQQRLQHEIKVICSMGYAGYFLIVADFIRWSLENGVPVGPGRGSGAGSLVAYALKITNLDPLKYELLFERFLNPERVSMPDFDIDFCMEGRDRVIDYVIERYGRGNVSQIITFGTMAARAVVRDVGRVLGHPYGFVDKIAKLIPFELGVTLEKAMQQEEILRTRYQQEEDVRNLIDLARRLEGVARNAGKHAGGVVIAPSQLTDFVPLFCEQNSDQWVSQFDKDDVEAIGLVKFDFLGLRTLTIIDWTLKTINAARKQLGQTSINIDQIPMDDPAAFKLLGACSTTGVFQLESRGMKDLIKRLKPDCFEDIIALVALFRPGPLQSGMVDEFMNRKHGLAAIEYLHPQLESILRPTYGVILYQEQVMQIAQVLAGYSLGHADILRRAMGKKKASEMAKQRAYFVEGASERGVTSKIAEQIFDLMEKFAGYGFNKSHSAAYALISYQTAWLKAHYPAEFMAAVLSSEMNNTDKIVIFCNECQRMQLKITPPDINHSQFYFSALDEKTIAYGLGAIKGVGQAAIDMIIAARARGIFHNLVDLCIGVDLGKVNRRVLESLIKAGAMDSFNTHRAGILAGLDYALRHAEQYSKTKARGQNDIFGYAQSDSKHLQVQHANSSEWTFEQKLGYERDVLGLYLSGHPLDAVRGELVHFTTAPLADIALESKKTAVLAGILTNIRILFTRRQERFAFITLDDGTARLEVAVFVEPYKKYQDLLEVQQILVIEVEMDYDAQTDNYRLNARSISSLDQARQHYAKCLRIRLLSHQCNLQLITEIKQILMGFAKGNCPVLLDYQVNAIVGSIVTGKAWWVTLNSGLIQRLVALVGQQAITIDYTA